ncbi:hypothetical protein [Dongia sedimenti]|uniref:Lipoprotein n=1 Tax=Dongia sedimenti TaxID=3064282 RepID=A0ABU0YQ04_9PROT|nr:hypothetical protein [Rhodospirillaceae bacterium R-7]
MPSRSTISFTLCGGALLGACGLGGGAPVQGTAEEEALRQADNLEVSAAAPPQQFTAYITGYSYWDNTPARSAEIALPVIHQTAGGEGTYADPITLAVGYAIVDGEARLDVPAGTRFYLQRLRKYAIVEDVCGDGPNPQNGPCHIGYTGHPWFDLYVGGADITAQKADACSRSITALQTVVMNPAPDLPVSAGGLAETAC